MGRLKVILLFDPSHLIQLVVFIEHLIFKNFILILFFYCLGSGSNRFFQPYKAHISEPYISFHSCYKPENSELISF